jgi:uncharacterized protein YndB with AHSA1/START domain
MIRNGRKTLTCSETSKIAASVSCEREGTAMGEIVIEVVIERPVEEVFAYLADNANEVEWQSNLMESTLTSDGPVGVGATGRDIRRSMGMKVVNEWECTAFEKNRMFAFAVSKPINFTASYRFDSAGEGTRVTMSAAPSGFATVVWPLMASMGRKQYAADFAKLKAVLEGSADGRGGCR